MGRVPRTLGIGMNKRCPNFPLLISSFFLGIKKESVREEMFEFLLHIEFNCYSLICMCIYEENQ